MVQKIMIFLTLSIMLTSCEKVIDIELSNSEPNIVIEANLRAGENDFIVTISKSTDFYLQEEQETIDNAVVKLSSSNGMNVIIDSKGNGKYLSTINAKEGEVYNLSVTIDDIEYKASSYLPNKVQILTIDYEFRAAAGPLDAGYLMSIDFIDNITEENFYRIVYFENGIIQNNPDDLLLFDDRLFDGGEVTYSLGRSRIDGGKLVELELRTIDDISYDYLTSLSDILGGGNGPGGGQAAPGNPINNWNYGILGNFTAYNVDTISIQLPQ